MARKIKIEQNKIIVPNDPVIPYIEGDGIGVDIWPAAQNVFDSAVNKAYGDKRKISKEEKVERSTLTTSNINTATKEGKIKSSKPLDAKSRFFAQGGIFI